MKEPSEIKEVKERYFYVEEFNAIDWTIEHDKFKIDAVYKAMKAIDKYYLDNLLKTAKHYFSCSLDDFQKYKLNCDKLKKGWEKVISDIQEAINSR